ncbi:DegV family protein [Paraconexibacter sp.]|uniref:DegV family protein n=1 Tax=Paraconexibacter sp. TaxID=2949640 RepID=UPI003561D8D2
MPVAIVTDTTHYIPAAILGEHGVQQVSLYINDADQTVREADIVDLDDYYERLKDLSHAPTTSQPSVGDFLAVYEPLAAAGNDIVSIHLSAAISGTSETARLAGEELKASYPDRQVAVVDSRSACAGLGGVALAAAAAARTGQGVEQVVRHAEDARSALKVWFAIDTLEYLRRGGRIGGAQAWIGGALKVKPILTCDGDIKPVERVRTAGKMFDRMVAYMSELVQDGADCWFIQHIQSPDKAAELVERGREIFDSEPLFVGEIGPVIGAHLGPGMLGVGGMPSRFLP